MPSPTNLAQRPSAGLTRVILKVSLVGEDSDSDFYIEYCDVDRRSRWGEWVSEDFWLDDLRGSYGRGGIRNHHQALYFFTDLDQTAGPNDASFVLQQAPAGPYERGRSGTGTMKNPRNPRWAGTALKWERVAELPRPSDDE